MINLHKEIRVFEKNNPLSKEEHNRFFHNVKYTLPIDYIQLMKYSNGIIFEIEVEIPLCIWDSDRCWSFNAEDKYFKGFRIGDDMGDYSYAYYHGHGGFGIYLIPTISTFENDLIYISDSLTSLLKKGYGVEKLNEKFN